MTPPGHVDINYLRFRVKVHELYERGLDNVEISERTGISTVNVRRYLKLVKPIIPPESCNHAWRDEAACKAYDSEMFFPTATGVKNIQLKEKAFEICASCPVIDKCREAALNNYENHGVWAGEDFGRYNYSFDESTGKVSISVRGMRGAFKKIC